jgi:hypothetical protein
MQETITCQQILDGAVDYTFKDFHKDLWEEVNSTVSLEDFADIRDDKERRARYQKTRRQVFGFVYTVCLQAAINYDHFKEQANQVGGEEKSIIEKTAKSNMDNISLLRAIFVRETSQGLLEGLSQKQAAKLAIKRCKDSFADWKPKDA